MHATTMSCVQAPCLFLPMFAWRSFDVHLLQVFVTLVVSVQYQVKRVLLYEDGPPPAAVSLCNRPPPYHHHTAVLNITELCLALAVVILCAELGRGTSSSERHQQAAQLHV